MADIKGPYNFRDSAHRRAMDVANLIEESTLPASLEGQEPEGIEIGGLWYNQTTNRMRMRTPTGDVDIVPGEASGTADSLETQAAPVDVSGSSPPQPGDVLTAVSDTSATWQPPAPASDPNTPVRFLATTPPEGEPYAGPPVHVGGSGFPEDNDILTYNGDGEASWNPPKPAKALAINDGDPFSPGVVVSGAEGPTAGQVLTATSGNTAAWQGLPSSGVDRSLLESELWFPPAAPHARDIEFNSTTLPAGFTWANATMVSITPDNGVPLTTSTNPATVPRYKVHTQRRASHLQWQTPADGAMRYIHVPWAAPTNACAWTRTHFFKYTTANTSQPEATENEAGLRFCLFADSGGVPDRNNYIYIELHYENVASQFGSVFFRVGHVVGGTDSRLPSAANAFYQVNQLSTTQYLGIRKTGTNYQLFSSEGSEGGLSLLDTTGTGAGTGVAFTPTIAHVGMRFIQAASPRIRTIFNCDFWRFADNNDALPW